MRKRAVLEVCLSGWALVAVTQGAVILALVILLVRRSRRDRVRESEERFRLMAERAPVMIWTTRPDTTLDYFNQTCMDFTGLPIEKLLGEGWLASVHPDDVERCIGIYGPAFELRQPFRMEYRIRGADGEYHWVLDVAVPRLAGDGSLAGYVGCTVDITDRKASEQATRESEAALHATNQQLRDLAGRLIASQEVERARIARDLHDDLSQQLAGLSIGLSGLKRQLSSLQGGGDLQAEVSTLQDRAIAAVEGIRHVSHDLHPTALEHAGLVAALSSHCADLQKQRGMTVLFTAKGDLEATDRTTALCLFRVAQEALRNVATHAKASRVDVRLLRDDRSIELTIADNGSGFNVVETRERNRGLGLVSINERVRLAGGTVSVKTELNRGTTIHVRLARGDAAA